MNAGPYFACGIAGKTKFDLGNDTERKVDTFGDDALKRFDAGLGVGVALEFGRIIAEMMIGEIPPEQTLWVISNSKGINGAVCKGGDKQCTI